MLGNGGGLELAPMADKCNKRAIAQSVLVRMLFFGSGIDIVLTQHIQSGKIGCQKKAQAGSF
jgi:hypothetical protein